MIGSLVRRVRGGDVPAAGRVRFGSFRRLTPFSRRWGKDRGGRPIDRYYIERFLAGEAARIRGRVLEVGDDRYTRLFGHAVDSSDVLHVEAGTPGATVVADLSRSQDLPPAQYDCIIATQVLQVIEDVEAAVRGIHRLLRPGGAVLATMTGIGQISRWDMDRWGEYWRFTTLSAHRLFARAFDPHDIEVRSYGNVLAATAYLYGMAAEELSERELEHSDPDYPVTIAVRAVRSDSPPLNVV
jgi:SAM-dependent methyltransferase